MATDPLRSLEALAATVSAAGVDDIYVEVRREVLWRRTRSGAVVRKELAREGLAVRRAGRLCSIDGVDRVALAELLDVRPSALPPVSLPRPPMPPADGESRLVASHAQEISWRWSWAAVLREGVVSVARRPPLLTATGPDGATTLGVWTQGVPPDVAPLRLPTARPPDRPCAVLLAPSAAAAFFHEVAGHGLEADLPDGDSPHRDDSLGKSLFDLPVDIDDDPTQTDLPGAFDCDDEGIVSGRRRLVAAGHVAALLTDRAAAQRLGTAGGNARRSDVHAPPRPRISNLIVSGSGVPLATLRSEARVEIERIAAGAYDAIGGDVRLVAAVAYRLHRGRRDARLGPVRVRVASRDVRSALAAISVECETTANPGWCRKHGDVVPTGGITPWIVLTGARIG